jgi:hypothetical protein
MVFNKTVTDIFYNRQITFFVLNKENCWAGIFYFMLIWQTSEQISFIRVQKPN